MVTDAQGYFRLDDIAFLGANFGTEFFLYGDIRARDPRGWLETRRIAIPARANSWNCRRFNFVRIMR